jgi:ABC-type Fe3+ transport system permease subunit
VSWQLLAALIGLPLAFCLWATHDLRRRAEFSVALTVALAMAALVLVFTALLIFVLLDYR